MTLDKHEALRDSFLLPIPELDQAADLLSQAVDRLFAGDTDHARDLLRRADMPTLRAFAASAMGRVTTEIHRFRVVANLLPELAMTERGRRMPPDIAKNEIFHRDGYRCRYCCCRIVLPKAQSILAKAMPGAVAWGNRDIELNAAFYTLKGVLDHVVPHAHGGGSDADNLVTSCQPCNYGKGNWFLEQVGLRDPRLRAPIVDGWDGLGRTLSFRDHVATTAAPPNPQRTLHEVPTTKQKARTKPRRPSIEEWLRELSDSDRLQVRALLDVVAGCRDLGISLSVSDLLVVRVKKGASRLVAFGVHKNGEVQVPWDAGGQKPALRPFAELLAASIPHAECYETAKMWRVRKHGRQIRIGELMAAQSALRPAFEELYAGVSESP